MQRVNQWVEMSASRRKYANRLYKIDLENSIYSMSDEYPFIDTKWIQWVFDIQTSITDESNDVNPLQWPLTISVQFSCVQGLILNGVLMMELMNAWYWSSVRTADIVFNCWQIGRRFLGFLLVGKIVSDSFVKAKKFNVETRYTKSKAPPHTFGNFVQHSQRIIFDYPFEHKLLDWSEHVHHINYIDTRWIQCRFNIQTQVSDKHHPTNPMVPV